MPDNLGEDLVGCPAERGEHLLAELADLHPLVLLQPVEGGAVLGVVLVVDPRVLRARSRGDQVPVALGKPPPERGVDTEGKLGGGFVHAWVVVVFGRFVELHGLVVPRADPLGRVNGSGFEILVDLAAGQGYRRDPELGHDVAADPGYAHLQAPQVVGGLDFLVEPTGPLDAGIPAGQALHAETACQLVPEFLASHPVHPGGHFGIGQAEGDGGEVRPAGVLSLPVVVDGMVHLRVARGDLVETVECADPLAGGEIVHVQPPVGHCAQTFAEPLGSDARTREIPRPDGHHGDFDAVLVDCGGRKRLPPGDGFPPIHGERYRGGTGNKAPCGPDQHIPAFHATSECKCGC